MTDWITKELATIIAALITGAVTIWVTWFKSKQSETSQPKDDAPRPKPAREVDTSNQTPIRDHADTPPGPPTTIEISDIKHCEITAHIMRVPPFQRSSIEDLYIGRRVRWLASLKSLSVRDGRVYFYGELFDGVHCQVSARGTEEAFASLIHSQEGDYVWLVGIIDSVSEAYTEIEDASATPSTDPRA